jgi:hypothetical protein
MGRDSASEGVPLARKVGAKPVEEFVSLPYIQPLRKNNRLARADSKKTVPAENDF